MRELTIKESKVLGTITYWTIHQGTYEFKEVLKTLHKHDLSEDLIIEPSAKKAFTRSCKSFVKGHTDKFDRKIVDDQRATVVGIVHEAKDSAHETLQYQHETTAKLFKASGSVKVNGADSDEFMEQYEHFTGHITHEDLQRMLRRLVARSHGLSLRETGGIYFIPEKSVEAMNKADAVLKELHAGQVYLLRVPKGKEEQKVTWERVTGHIEETIKDVLTKVANIEKKAACLSHHEDRLKEAKKMLDYYAELTESEAMLEELREQISTVANDIAGKAAEFQRKTEAKEAEKAAERAEKKKAREAKRAEKKAAKAAAKAAKKRKSRKAS